MIRKLYTITRDAILGLTELPALHLLALEATDRRVDDLAKKRAVEYCNTEYDQDIANLTEDRDGLLVKLSSILSELGWHKSDPPNPGEIRREINKLFEELSVEKHVGELQWGLAREKISGQEQHIKEVEEVLERVKKERDELKAQLARHVEAERWHQVTAGEGELPPGGIEMIGRYGAQPPLFFFKDAPTSSGTYEWRYASSEDVSNV